MTMIWNDGGSFEEHAKRMRAFRKSHASVSLVNGPRFKEPAFLESTRPLHVADIRRETGESRRYVSTEDWSALVPILKVAQYRLWQN